jgi:SAM-dependent methyltransferase
MMDFIYGHPSVTATLDAASDLGRGLARFSASASYPARGVQWRRRRVAQEIEHLVETRGTIDVFAFACGHLREFDLVRPDLRGCVRFVAADADEISLDTVQSSYSQQGDVACSRTSLRQLLGGKARRLGRFDFVYTLGLLDYVSGRAAGRVVERLWEMLRPSGTLLAANFTNSTRGAGYMEAAMDWWLEYRDPAEVGAWAQTLGGLQSIDVFEDPLRQIAYLLARKR